MLYLEGESEPISQEMKRAVLAAEGYLYLGMSDEALEELNSLPLKEQMEVQSLRARIRVLLHQKNWKDAEALSLRGTSLHPYENEFMVQRAFALHQLKRGSEAVGVILSAPDWIRRSGILHYNLGCYEAKLGDLTTARQCIKAAVELNSSFRKKAKIDPDLERLWS